MKIQSHYSAHVNGARGGTGNTEIVCAVEEVRGTQFLYYIRPHRRIDLIS